MEISINREEKAGTEERDRMLLIYYGIKINKIIFWIGSKTILF